jgi:hypothetical protein
VAVKRHISVKDPKAERAPFRWLEPRRLRRGILLGGRSDVHGTRAVVVGSLHPIQITGHVASGVRRVGR